VSASISRVIVDDLDHVPENPVAVGSSYLVERRSAESFVVVEMEGGSPYEPYVTHNVGALHCIYPSARLRKCEVTLATSGGASSVGHDWHEEVQLDEDS
jgi:hypothetical protein